MAWAVRMNTEDPKQRGQARECLCSTYMLCHVSIATFWLMHRRVQAVGEASQYCHACIIGQICMLRNSPCLISS
jgi:hypothetical protein